jgi:hypothetical protein
MAGRDKPELFELEMLGGSVERRWRRLRPDVERMPWGTLAVERPTGRLLEAGRRFWTRAAHNEHRTAAASAVTLEALIAARAPLDLVAVASRFVSDELAHVELCARVTAELGEAAPVAYDGDHLYPAAEEGLPVLLRAADYVVRFYCVGESFSVAMAHAAAKAATHPLVAAVLGRISRDEAAHGSFGWTFFDWVGERLGDDERTYLRERAKLAIADLRRSWETLPEGDAGESLGWLGAGEYRRRGLEAVEEDVLAPLAARGLG